MARHRNVNWDLPEPKLQTWERVLVAVAMDIRDELQTLNRLLSCPNFMTIPHTLKGIQWNTARRTKKRRL